jgi:integrase
VSPYRAKGAKTFKLRIRLAGGRDRVCSCGTDLKVVARDVERFVQSLKATRRWDVLEAIVAGRVKLAAAYDHRHTLDAFMTQAQDVDLSPLVTEWEAAGANAKYVKQVRRMIPTGKPYPRTRFTKGELRKFLDTLPVADSTKNRYRAALSAFAGWLSERDVLEVNPVRSVKGKAHAHRPVVYLEPAQAKALVAALPRSEHQAAEALMAATGIEWGALAAMRRRDVDLAARTFHCFPGLAGATGKTRYRSRIVLATEDWAWDYIEAHVAALPPNARLFTLREDIALRTHKRISKAIGLPVTTLHHWRHTYAVSWLKRGRDHQILKNQLGHSPRSTLIYTTYGPWIVTTADYRKRAEMATNVATTPEVEV